MIIYNSLQQRAPWGKRNAIESGEEARSSYWGQDNLVWLLWEAGLKEDLEEQIGLPRQMRETMFARLMEQLEQNPRDEEGGRRSEHMARMQNAWGFVIGEETEVGVKLGYIKALFSCPRSPWNRFQQHQLQSQPLGRTSGPGVLMTHTCFIKIHIPFVSSHIPGPQSCLCHLYSVSWGRGMPGWESREQTEKRNSVVFSALSVWLWRWVIQSTGWYQRHSYLALNCMAWLLAAFLS